VPWRPSSARTARPAGRTRLPPSLLTDLMGQIRCDMLSLDGWDAGRQMCWFSQEIPSGIYCEALAQVFGDPACCLA
jgi:hypothetical protein